MGKSVRHDIRVFDTIEEVSRAAALGLIDQIKQTLARQNLFSLVLAGGQTPRRLYELLATEFRQAAPWNRLRLYVGDERFVPPDDPRSNYRMIKEAMLARLPVIDKNVYIMPTSLHTPEQAALSYENILRSHYDGAWPRFDLVILGLGPDGHTASLFPNSPALEESGKWVLVSQGPEEPKTRLTLSLPAINNAAAIYFLVTGKDKAKAFKNALGEPSRLYPASLIHPNHGRLSWWIDEGAASSWGK
jgi:6-phosphogluconolactonase